MMLDPAHGESLPHSLISSFHLPPVDAALATLVAGFSESVADRCQFDPRSGPRHHRRVTAAVTWVLGFSLAAGILVLLAALAATADERRFEIALLRTLGAHRGQLTAAVLGEFAALGLIAGAGCRGRRGRYRNRPGASAYFACPTTGRRAAS